MRTLLLGIGAVGAVVAKHLATAREIEQLALADVNTHLAQRLAASLDREKVSVQQLDASDPVAVKKALKGYDLVINAALPKFNRRVMEAALSSGCHYLDLASGEDDQLALDERFRSAGLVGLMGVGEDPGISNVMARWGANRLDTVQSIKVRDGETVSEAPYPFVCLFSPETFLEEAFSQPLLFEHGKTRRLAPLSEPELYPFSEPVGLLHCYPMDHEEVYTLPRFIGKGVQYVDFKLALTPETVTQLRTFEQLGLLRTDEIQVRGTKVRPRDVFVSLMPSPAELGGRVGGYVALAVEVVGMKGGKRAGYRLYASMSHRAAFEHFGVTGTAYYTGTGAAAGAILLAQGGVKARGVLPPEMLDPEPYFRLLAERKIPIETTPLSEAQLAA